MPRSADAYCTCFLLRKLTRKVTQAYDRAIAPSGLTITQYSLLRHLERKPGISVSTLAQRMGMERTTLVRTLKPVVQAGWARYGERESGRSAELELTPKGAERLANAAPLWSRAQGELRAQLGGARTEELHTLLRASLSAVEEERLS
jgi:DNA-binding MarR family transcriptional regulator